MKTFKGSELNRLARQVVTERDKQLRGIDQLASFSNWELIVDSPPRLVVTYGVYGSRSAARMKGKQDRLCTETQTVTLAD